MKYYIFLLKPVRGEKPGGNFGHGSLFMEAGREAPRKRIGQPNILRHNFRSSFRLQGRLESFFLYKTIRIWY